MVARSTTIRDKHRSAISRIRPPCALCGKPIDYALKYPHEESFVVDHIIPLNKGGSDNLDNKQPAHRNCNRAKSDKLIAPIIRRSTSLNRPSPRDL